MKTTPLLGKTIVGSENLIGTRWVGWSNMFCGRLEVEFLDKTNCIYTSMPDKYPMTYTVTEGKIFFSDIDIKEPFELRGNMLFTGDLPVFKKAA